MKILQIHNYCLTRGGHDNVMASEARLLAEHGHEVLTYTEDNTSIEQRGAARTVVDSFWNMAAYRQIRRLIQETRPDVAHVHNTFPIVSPSAYYACRAEKVPVVHTLHDFRLVCTNALLYREGAPCTECLGRVWSGPALRHRCYKNSLAHTAISAGILGIHRLLKSYHLVQRYVALTDGGRRMFQEGLLPADRLVVKPNFVHGPPVAGAGDGGYALFVGRLVAEKGIATLLETWDKNRDLIPLKIVGDGAMRDVVQEAAKRNPNIEWLGGRTPDEILPFMMRAALVLVPSEWMEGGFPLVGMEALSCGTPVICSRLGAMEEAVVDGVTGMRFRAGDSVDLARAVRAVIGSESRLAAMRENCRAEWEGKYSPTVGYRNLQTLYREASELAAKDYHGKLCHAQ